MALQDQRRKPRTSSPQGRDRQGRAGGGCSWKGGSWRDPLVSSGGPSTIDNLIPFESQALSPPSKKHQAGDSKTHSSSWSTLASRCPGGLHHPGETFGSFLQTPTAGWVSGQCRQWLMREFIPMSLWFFGGRDEEIQMSAFCLPWSDTHWSIVRMCACSEHFPWMGKLNTLRPIYSPHQLQSFHRMREM